MDSARDILLARFRDYLEAWQQRGFSWIRDQWQSRSYEMGAAIRVNEQGRSLVGTFAGLDIDGALLLDLPDGRKRVLAGDILQ